MTLNEVILLKEENEKQSIELREDDERTIKNIMKSMSIFKVNSYDAQVIQRDLIGMAQELKLRNSSLQEAIGDDVKGFTNEIINNSSGPCKREILLNFLFKLSGYFFVWFTGLALGAYGGLSWEANPIIYLYYIGIVLIIFITEGMITPLFITEKGIKKKLSSVFSLVLFVVFSTIIYFLNDNLYTIEINGGYIIVISAIVYLIIKYLNRININILAKGKKNYIDDLK
jgi:DNA-binding ferritin-like protein (Dps family)